MKTLFLGDVCPTKASTEKFKEKDMEALFSDTASLFEESEFSFVNLECALTESDAQPIEKFGPNLKGPVRTAEALKKLGVNCCGLSNNHVFDFGVQGAKDTLKVLEDNGLSYTGFGEDYENSRKNFIFEKDGEKICIIAVCEHEYSYALEDRMGSRPYDEYDTMEDIRNAKADSDRVIVIYHGGKEHCRYPSPRLLKLCRAMAKNGADMVLCQHSHCIGAYENYEGCHILYGQGNFHFVKYLDKESWATALAVKYDTKSGEIEFIPTKETECGVCLIHGEEKDEIINSFKKRNAEILSGEWIDGWRKFCESVREGYTQAVANAFAPNSTEKEDGRFGHYLDCEAHTDVWRELFKTANHTNCKGEK